MDDEKIKGNLSQFIHETLYTKEKLFHAIESSNQRNSYKIDFNELLAKISHNPELINPQEASLLYYWFFNEYVYESADNIELSNYGFDEFHDFGRRATSENILQELWNFFDPFDQHISISPDYIYSQKECYDFVSYLCTLTAIFQANNSEDTQSWQYLAQNKEYIPRALARYTFEQQKQQCIEQNEDISEFYEKNKDILDVIGHHDVFGDYTHLSYSFLTFVDLRRKISEIKLSVRILLLDSY